MLCIITNQPLVFGPANYSPGSFIVFGLLIACLCFSLVFVNLPFLRYIKEGVAPNARDDGFYIILTLLVLQGITLLTGYLESSFTKPDGGDLLYYYKGVTNSHIYIITGNLTTIIVASSYAKEQVRLKKEVDTIFDFDKEKVEE